jgi:hypothetical protein
MGSFAAAAGVVSKGVDLLDKIGILARVKNKLISSPDAAAAKLTFVLSELGKTYQIVDDTLIGFASMTFDDANARGDALMVLNKARGGRLEATMMEARAHCHKVWYIYDRYLTGWFSRVLDAQEQSELRELFSRLAAADGSWIDMLAGVAVSMQQTSDKMLDCLDNDDAAGARAVQRDVLKSFRLLQDRLGKGLVELQRLKQEFSTISGGMDI